MKTRADLMRAIQAGKRFKYLLFWGHKPRPDGEIGASCFSQWWSSPFQVDGIGYATAEHYMMAGKARLFREDEALTNILNSRSPAQAKRLGRQVRGFDEATWQSHRFDLVVTGSVHKFSQHPELSSFLVGTGRRVLVEASPVDSIWGIGLAADHEHARTPTKWRGENLLGFALMEARKRLAT